MVGLIDVGGTKLLAAVASGGEVTEPVVRRPTPQSGDVVAMLAEMLDEARAGERLDAIAAAVPGPFDRATGRLLSPPGLTPDWHQQAIAGPLQARFGCDVVTENDANCAALAEARLGAGRGGRLVVYYTVSTGIGSGTVRDGRLVVERHDSEGGHQVLWPPEAGGPECECGGAGCLEAIASGRAIARRFGRPPEEIDDEAVWGDVGHWLGLAVVNATALLDCDTVVFGGGVADARWEALRPSIERTVARHLHLQPAPAVRHAELGGTRNLTGALLVLRDLQGEGDPGGAGARRLPLRP